jgi:hypothetical protein
MLANAGIDPRQPAVLHAADACVSVTHGLLTNAAVAHFAAEQNSPSAPSSAGAPTHAQMLQGQQDAVKFAQCMRSHGVNIPDPGSTAGGGFGFRQAFRALDRNSPAFQSALTACQSLRPRFGRRGSF